MRYFISLFLFLACSMAPIAARAEVALIGTIGDKAAVIAIDGGDPKTVKVGQTWRGVSQTANGPVQFYAVKLETVRLGSIELTGVEAIVIERGLDIALLGMSFLGRVEMKQEGRTMTLIRRF